MSLSSHGVSGQAISWCTWTQDARWQLEGGSAPLLCQARAVGVLIPVSAGSGGSGCRERRLHREIVFFAENVFVDGGPEQIFLPALTLHYIRPVIQFTFLIYYYKFLL